jgi:hypothetical protein
MKSFVSNLSMFYHLIHFLLFSIDLCCYSLICPGMWQFPSVWVINFCFIFRCNFLFVVYFIFSFITLRYCYSFNFLVICLISVSFSNRLLLSSNSVLHPFDSFFSDSRWNKLICSSDKQNKRFDVSFWSFLSVIPTNNRLQHITTSNWQEKTAT